jgi:heme o synthase
MKFSEQIRDGATARSYAAALGCRSIEPGAVVGESTCFVSPVGSFAVLTKINLAAATAFSVATGYAINAGVANGGIVTSSLGSLLLAMGACALNQCQDRTFDARMLRTRGRPIPSGELRPATALGITLGLIAAGFLFLLKCHGLAVAGAAMLAILLYNGFYTYLKRIWAFAAVPGALIGALPPIIGWMAAGGKVSNPRIIALALFLFVWQVPHFWLLVLMSGEDYERAGLPSLTKSFGFHQLSYLTFVWILTASATGVLLPVYGLISSLWTGLALLACCLAMVAKGAWILREDLAPKSLRQIFRSINLYALCIMTILIMDSALSK